MKEILTFLKKQLVSKTNWIVLISILFYVLKYFGLIENIPEGYGLGSTTAAIVAVIIKILKTLYYKFQKPITIVK